MQEIMDSLEDPKVRKRLGLEQEEADAEDKALELARALQRMPVRRQPVVPKPNAVAVAMARTLYRN